MNANAAAAKKISPAIKNLILDIIRGRKSGEAAEGDFRDLGLAGEVETLIACGTLRRIGSQMGATTIRYIRIA